MDGQPLTLPSGRSHIETATATANAARLRDLILYRRGRSSLPSSNAAPPSFVQREPRRARRQCRGEQEGQGAGAEGGRHQNDRLVEAVRLVGREVDPGVAGADILELAMAKGPMFSWLRYWPEEGYPEEGRPY